RALPEPGTARSPDAPQRFAGDHRSRRRGHGSEEDRGGDGGEQEYDSSAVAAADRRGIPAQGWGKYVFSRSDLDRIRFSRPPAEPVPLRYSDLPGAYVG